MRASDLIAALEAVKKQHGDLNVYVDTGTSFAGLQPVDEVDVDTDDTGIILWLADGAYEEGRQTA